MYTPSHPLDAPLLLHVILEGHALASIAGEIRYWLIYWNKETLWLRKDMM